MRTLSWEEFSESFRAEGTLAATIGVFDGLHRGHRELIGRVLSRDGMVKTVLTFRENPKRVLRPSSFHGNLSTLGQKLGALEDLGLDLCVLIDFSGIFSKLAGRKFLSLVRERGNLRYLAVGTDFRCGHRLDIGAEDIRDYYAGFGVEAEILQPVMWAGHPVSSSRIRKAVVEGRLDDAAAMLGGRYELDLREGDALGFEGGRLRIAAGETQVLPPEGLYEATALGGEGEFNGSAVLRKGVWSLDLPEGFMPSALRLVRLASRE